MAKRKYHEWLEPDALLKLRGWARRGYIDTEIAGMIGITTTTFYDWMKRFPAFSEALKKGKDSWDDEVEEAMYASAVGYYKDEDVIVKDSDGNQSVRRMKKWHPPNTTAQIFILKNRRPKEWRDRKMQEVEIKKPTSETASELSAYLDGLDAADSVQ